MAKSNKLLTIGETARRSGVAASTLRFYETKNLISSHRNRGNQRLYDRSMLRIISIIRVAQTLRTHGNPLSIIQLLQKLESLIATSGNPHETEKHRAPFKLVRVHTRRNGILNVPQADPRAFL